MEAPCTCCTCSASSSRISSVATWRFRETTVFGVRLRSSPVRKTVTEVRSSPSVSCARTRSLAKLGAACANPTSGSEPGSCPPSDCGLLFRHIDCASVDKVSDAAGARHASVKQSLVSPLLGSPTPPLCRALAGVIISPLRLTGTRIVVPLPIRGSEPCLK